MVTLESDENMINAPPELILCIAGALEVLESILHDFVPVCVQNRLFCRHLRLRSPAEVAARW